MPFLMNPNCCSTMMHKYSKFEIGFKGSHCKRFQVVDYVGEKIRIWELKETWPYPCVIAFVPFGSSTYKIPLLISKNQKTHWLNDYFSFHCSYQPGKKTTYWITIDRYVFTLFSSNMKMNDCSRLHWWINEQKLLQLATRFHWTVPHPSSSTFVMSAQEAGFH